MHLPCRTVLRLTAAGLLAFHVSAAPFLVASFPSSAGRRPAESPIQVPLHRIDRAYRDRAASLMTKPTIVRRLPKKTFVTDARIYEYLLDHLPLSSRLSGLLGFGRYTVVQLGDGLYHGRDRHGVSGEFRTIYSKRHKRVYIGEGSFDPWFAPRITGEVLLVLEYRASQGPTADPPVVETRIDVYLKTNRLVGYILEMLGAAADERLTKLVSSAQRTSEALWRDPEAVWSRMKVSGLFSAQELRSFRAAVLTGRAEGDSIQSGPGPR